MSVMEPQLELLWVQNKGESWQVKQKETNFGTVTL
jgi:hypothetical protein